MIDLKNLVSLPTYTTTIPSTGEELSFRPFVVKEEKKLLIALESKDTKQILNAIKTVMESCYYGKVDIDKMPYYDAEYLFIQLRMKSMGEVVEIVVRDPNTKERFETEMKLETIKILNNNQNKDKFNIRLNDNLGVIMKYPSLREFTQLTDEKMSKTEIIFNFLAASIDKIYTKEKILDIKDMKNDEIKSFIENLPKDMFKKLSAFFYSMPVVVYEDEYTTPTGNKIPISVRDFTNFFA